MNDKRKDGDAACPRTPTISGTHTPTISGTSKDAQVAKQDATGAQPIWRVGTKIPLNVYAGDTPICQCHSAAMARRIVDAVNAYAGKQFGSAQESKPALADTEYVSGFLGSNAATPLPTDLKPICAERSNMAQDGRCLEREVAACAEWLIDHGYAEAGERLRRDRPTPGIYAEMRDGGYLALAKQRDEARTERERLRKAAAWAYQAIGARWPNKEALDNLSALINGRPLPCKWPVVPPSDEDRLREENERLKCGIEWANAEKHGAQADAEREKNTADSLRTQLAAAQQKITEIGEQLEFDRTKVAESMTAANKAVDGRHWLTEGRGPYEWNDDNWHKEFAAAAVEIKAALEPLTKIAANWANCPMKGEEVALARIDLKAKLSAAQAEAKQAQIDIGVVLDVLHERNAELAAAQELADMRQQSLVGASLQIHEGQLREIELEKQAEKLAEALDEVREILTHSEMQCHHPADDGSDDCGNVDDCIFHAVMQAIDAALAAYRATKENKHDENRP